jgi:nucleoside-diphosphate-sugar epimerase
MIEAYIMLSSHETLDAKIIRLPALFGHESLEPRFLRYFAQCATKRQEVIFHQFKNGSARVPLVNVNTCAHWLAKSLTEYRSLPALSHLGHSTPTPTISEIATAVAKRAGVAAKGVSIERTAFTGHFHPDILIPREIDAALEIQQFIARLCEHVK